jgi:MFS transporter, PAT family, beta-lactamase induction signal transducer AmpG
MKMASESALLRFILPFCLCIGEGLFLGLFLFVLLPWLQAQGVSTQLTDTLVALVMVPYVFKLAWGPAIDRRRGGRLGDRRPWMIVGQTGMAVACLGFAWVDEPTEALALVTSIGALAMTFMALQTVATDGFLVTGVPERERSTVNAGCFLGQLCGVVLASTVVAAALKVSWRHMALAMAGIQSILLLAPILIRERRAVAPTPADDPRPRTSWSGILSELRPLFRGRSLLALAGGLAFRIMVQVAQTSDATLTVDRGWDTATYSMRFGGSFAGGAVLGAVTAAVLGRGGHYTRVMAGAAVSFAAALLAFALAHRAWDEPWIFIARWITTGFAATAGAIALYSIFQRFSKPALAATHLSLYTSVINAGGPLGAVIAAGVAILDPQFGKVYLLLGILALLTAAVTPWMRPR